MRTVFFPTLFALLATSSLFLGCDDEKKPTPECIPYSAAPLPSEALTFLTPGVVEGDVRVGTHPVAGGKVVFVERDINWDWGNHYYYGGTLRLWDLSTGAVTNLNESNVFADETTGHDPSLRDGYMLARMTEHIDNEYYLTDYIHNLGAQSWEEIAIDHTGIPWPYVMARFIGESQSWYLLGSKPPAGFEDLASKYCGIEHFDYATGTSNTWFSWGTVCTGIAVEFGRGRGAFLVRGEVHEIAGPNVEKYVSFAGREEYEPIAIHMEDEDLLIEAMQIYEHFVEDATRLFMETEIFKYRSGALTQITESPGYIIRHPRYTAPLLVYVDRRLTCDRRLVMRDEPGGSLTLLNTESRESLPLPPIVAPGADGEPELLRPIALLKNPWRLVVARYGTESTPAKVPGNLVVIDLEAAGLVESSGALVLTGQP